MCLGLVLPVAAAEISQEITLGSGWGGDAWTANTGYDTTISWTDYNASVGIAYNRATADKEMQLDEIRANARLNRLFDWGFAFKELGYRHENVDDLSYSRVTIGAGKELLPGLSGEAGLTVQVEEDREIACKLGFKYLRIVWGVDLKSGLNMYLGIGDWDALVRLEAPLGRKGLDLVLENRYVYTADVGRHIGSLGIKYSF